MIVFLRTLAGVELPLEVSPEETIESYKKRIDDLIGCPWYAQRLVLNVPTRDKRRGGEEMPAGAKIQRGWVPQAVREVTATLPSMKVFTYEEACGAARERLRLMLSGEYWRFKSCRKVARNRFHRFQLGQKALDDMVNAIAPPSHRSAVVFGDFSGRRALKGEAGVAPVKKLRRDHGACSS